MGSDHTQTWAQLTYVLHLTNCEGQLAAQSEDSLMHRAGQEGELGQLAQILAVHGRLHGHKCVTLGCKNPDADIWWAACLAAHERVPFCEPLL